MATSLEHDPDQVLRALEQNLWEMWSRFGRGEQCALHETDDATWFDTPIPTLPYNAVVRFSPAADTDRRIDALFDHYRRRGMPFVWIVHPSARPLSLADRLLERGLEEAEACPGMSRELDILPPREGPPLGITIAEVTDARNTDSVLELVAWRWSVPDEARRQLTGVTRAFGIGQPEGAVRVWLAQRDGAPVAKIIVQRSGSVAGIYGVATKPEARGQGRARTLTIHALHEARAAGCTRAVLHSTPVALGLYEKLGFRTHGIFRIFAPPGALHL